jgi:3-oxoadipyl-CoA thiolase
MERNRSVDWGALDDVILGCANQAGEDNRNVARMAALLAGLPASAPGSTVNRLCASGLEAVNVAARMIEANHGDVFIAGGVESMSRAPYVLSKAETAFDRSQQIFDTSIGWRLINPRMAAMYHPFSMGETAENVARQRKVSRADQDQFALQSQQRWSAAHQGGRFAEEIVPVEIPQRKGAPTLVSVDEHPRPDTTLEKLAKLKPVFAKDDQGTVTAGNSSGINDGAAALLIVEAGLAKSLGLEPIAFIGPSAAAGVDPAFMGLGPVPAIRKALLRANLTLDRIDLFELNEAFAAQALACQRELGIPNEKLNVNGGAIAIGHPLGCSGARLATTLVHQMARTGAARGIASLCVGVGQGLATVFERE